MKRIAKYNLDRDFEEINKNIESAKSQLNALQEEISDYLSDKPQEDDYEESEDDWE